MCREARDAGREGVVWCAVLGSGLDSKLTHKSFLRNHLPLWQGGTAIVRPRKEIGQFEA